MQRWMPVRGCLVRGALVATFAVALIGCGGSDGDDDAAPPDNTPARGRLIGAESLQQFSVAQMNAALQEGGTKLPDVAAAYAVDAYRLTYWTADVDGTLVPASGLVAVPVQPETPGPVVSYQHGTTFYNDEAPSVRIGAGEPPMIFASLGSVVVAADGLGFGASNDVEHPYLQSQPTAQSTLDMLAAAESWRDEHAVADSGQLYFLGYSEGGYASMAAQREQALHGSNLRSRLVATIAGAGPYDMLATLDGLLEQVNDEIPLVGHVLKPGKLHHLPREIRDEVRRAIERRLIPDDADVDYATPFIDDYLADDRDLIAQNNSVHLGWKPEAPVYLFHGRDDQTVPYAASESALKTLQKAGGAPVTLRTCTSQPAGHIQCVAPFIEYALGILSAGQGN